MFYNKYALERYTFGPSTIHFLTLKLLHVRILFLA